MHFVMLSNSKSDPGLPKYWREFLEEVDRQLPESVELHCLGGFVLTACYGLPRRTGDLDYISVLPAEGGQILETVAGKESKLAKKYKLYFQHVTVADVPENYAERLIEMFRGGFSHMRLFALEVHDLVLAKLIRNYTVDLEDAKYLAKSGVLNPGLLRERYEQELRPYLANQEKHDLTLQLWLEACFPV